MCVNVVGSFLIGGLMTLAQRSTLLVGPVRDMVTVGFLGALTTFSTFSWETLQFFRDGAFLLGGLNIVANCVLCLVAVAAGMAVWAGVS